MALKTLDKNDVGYIDVTDEWLNKAIPNSHEVLDSYYYITEDKVYMVDGSKNVILDYSLKELEVAIWIENTFGGRILMKPRVNIPFGIKTADYQWNGEYWDLKEIKSSGKRVFDNRINNYSHQAKNYIFDVTESNLSNKEIRKQIAVIYNSKDRIWLNKIIIKNGNKVVCVYERKRLPPSHAAEDQSLN